MSGVTLIATALAASFCVLSILHIAWALGVQGGKVQVLPERDGAPLFQPRPLSTLAVAAVLLLAALIVTQRAGLGRELLPAALVNWGCWGVSLTLVLRAIGEFRYVGFFKRVRHTAFARMDTRYYSPLALALGIGAGIVANGGW